MSHSRIAEKLKVDVALDSQSISTAVTSRYYDLSGYRKALFCWEVGALTAVQTSVAQVMVADNTGGTNGAVLTGAAATINNTTADVVLGATEATVVVSAPTVGNTITINGVTFTAAAAASLANRQFDQSGDNTADAASLVAGINDAEYGVPGVTASAVTNTITLRSTVPGETTISVTGTASTLVPAITAAVGYLEVDATQLGADKTAVAIRITNTGAQSTSAVLLRGDARLGVEQAVGAGLTF
jgi:hypothetical protein